MNFDPASLFLSIIAGAFGTAYFIYGKKRTLWVPMIAGIALMVVPFLFDALWLQIILCVGLAVVPWVVREG